jgi:hydrogenase-4 component E
MIEFISNNGIVLVTIIFVCAILVHIAKKNSLAVWIYVVQSIAISLILLSSPLAKYSPLFLIATISTIVVKSIVAPYFFFDLIKKHELKFSASTYLSIPRTLLVIAILSLFSRLDFIEDIAYSVNVDVNILAISMATVFTSIFLIINRKGALSQMIGILSLENGVVSFAFFAGLEQSGALQIGITFDILVWIIIASIFGSMIHRQFGSLDVTEMKNLTE